MNNFNNFHFENGLPKVLAARETEKNFQLAKDGDKNAKKLLIEHNLRLVSYIINKSFRNVSIDVDDLMGIGSFGLMKAVETFDTEKGVKFPTYATRVISNEILMALRKNKKSNADISMEEILNEDSEGNELSWGNILSSEDDTEEAYMQSETRQVVKKSLEILDDVERQVVELYYGFHGERLTQDQISKKLGYSQSYICRIEMKARKKLGEYLETQGQGHVKKDSKKMEYVRTLNADDRLLFYANTIVDTGTSIEDLSKSVGTSVSRIKTDITMRLPGLDIELYQKVNKALDSQDKESKQRKKEEQNRKKQLKLQEKEAKQKIRDQYQLRYDYRTRVDTTEKEESKGSVVMKKLSSESTKVGEAVIENVANSFFDLFPNYTKEQVLSVVYSLNGESKQILQLRYGLNENPITSTKDIAEKLGKDIANVYARLGYIKKTVAKNLDNPKTSKEAWGGVLYI